MKQHLALLTLLSPMLCFASVNNVVGYWLLAENAEDISGNQHHGTENGQISYLTEGSVQFARFNAEKNQYISLSDYVEAFQNLNQGTISAWIRTKTPEAAAIFTMSDSRQASSELRLFSEWGQANFGVRDNGTLNEANSSRFIANNEWTHLVVSNDGEVSRYFVNGYEITPPKGEIYYTDAFFSSISAPNHVSIGRNIDADNTNGQWFFDGDLARIKVLNTPMESAHQVVEEFSRDYRYFGRDLPLIEDGEHINNASRLTDQIIFDNENPDNTCYRIPAIIEMLDSNDQSVLIAMSEQRLNGCGDHGVISIVSRISHDGGKIWQELNTLVDASLADEHDGGNYHIVGNPAPFIYTDFKGTQKLGLVFNTSTYSEGEVNSNPEARRYVWFQSFVLLNGVLVEDSEPQDITGSVTDPDWNAWIAMTPGHAVTLSNGIVAIPGNHYDAAEGQYYPHMTYFNPTNGVWSYDGEMDKEALRGGNESTAAEFDGRLVVSIRNQGKNGDFPYSRFIATAPIPEQGIPEAKSWYGYQDAETVDPVVQGSVVDFSDAQTNRFVLTNAQYASNRVRLTAKVAYSQHVDGTIEWSDRQRVIYQGSSAYVDIVASQYDGTHNLGVLYERGNDGGIYFTMFNLEWLTHGHDMYQEEVFVQ
ncbi:sialidase family protein [Aliivibrio fischeri]|uniref:sialidase family protein n=1 Tax=Aliivibrio fischeri TaxID=668 RepID=UPI0018C6D22C|nr:sialidase family protein [Aliivibrio fischeri]